VLHDNIICGGDEMVVYALRWETLRTEGDSRRVDERAGDTPSAPSERGGQ
jgi:hypothetical protein